MTLFNVGDLVSKETVCCCAVCCTWFTVSVMLAAVVDTIAVWVEMEASREVSRPMAFNLFLF